MFVVYRACCLLLFEFHLSILNYILTHRTYSHYSLSIDDDFNFWVTFFHTYTFTNRYTQTLRMSQLLPLLLFHFLFPGKMLRFSISLSKYVLFKTNMFHTDKMKLCKVCSISIRFFNLGKIVLNGIKNGKCHKFYYCIICCIIQGEHFTYTHTHMHFDPNRISVHLANNLL